MTTSDPRQPFLPPTNPRPVTSPILHDGRPTGSVFTTTTFGDFLTSYWFSSYSHRRYRQRVRIYTELLSRQLNARHMRRPRSLQTGNRQQAISSSYTVQYSRARTVCRWFRLSLSRVSCCLLVFFYFYLLLEYGENRRRNRSRPIASRSSYPTHTFVICKLSHIAGESFAGSQL